MKCSDCQFENPTGMKFCVECGNKFAIICPNCGFKNSPSFKFCGECGSKLQKPKKTQKELSFVEKIDKIQRYLKRLPIIYTVLGSYSLWVEEDFLEAFQNLKKALEISEKNNDNTSLWYASFFLGITLSLNCEFEKGLEYLKKSLDLAFVSNNPIMITFAKSLMSTFNYIFHGKANLAYQMSQESLSTAQENGDVYLMGMAYSSCGIACFCKGLFKEAENMLSLALSFCEKTALLGWGTWGTGFLGHSYAELGEYKTAIDIYRNGISELERANLFPFLTNFLKLSTIRLKVLDDDRLNHSFKFEGLLYRLS